MIKPVLVFAIGNESRGDDALGPLLLRHLQQEDSYDQVDFLEDFQLQVEHAADLVDRELVLFIDAGLDTPAPYAFYRACAGEDRTLYSHALTPEAVLATYVQVYQAAPPPSFVLCVCGNQFELGSGLSARSGQHLELAAKFAHRLLHDADTTIWEKYITL